LGNYFVGGALGVVLGLLVGYFLGGLFHGLKFSTASPTTPQVAGPPTGQSALAPSPSRGQPSVMAAAASLQASDGRPKSTSPVPARVSLAPQAAQTLSRQPAIIAPAPTAPVEDDASHKYASYAPGPPPAFVCYTSPQQGLAQRSA
jgi:predicted lipid-binding transport protein (Tim44 family)